MEQCIERLMYSTRWVWAANLAGPAQQALRSAPARRRLRSGPGDEKGGLLEGLAEQFIHGFRIVFQGLAFFRKFGFCPGLFILGGGRLLQGLASFPGWQSGLGRGA